MDKNVDKNNNYYSPRFYSLFKQKNSLTILSFLAALFYLPFLGSYSLLGEWESVFGRVALEMTASNSWDWFLNPKYLGNYDFWSHPIFCYWMVFPFIKIFGPTELALRLPFALNGIAFVILVFYITKRLFNDDFRGFVAGFITLFLPFTFLITRQFMWDITFVTFTTGATGFLYLGWRDNDRKLLRFSYLFMGLGMLTKGLLALFIPTVIFAIYSIASADYSSGFKTSFKNLVQILKKARVLEGIAIFFVTASWWYIYMGFRHGIPFFLEFFGKHHFARLAGNLNEPDGPFEFYVWELGIGTFPWIGFFAPGLLFAAKKVKEKKEELFVMTAFFVPFLFFTLCGTKFPHYIFTIIPFFAIITAVAFVKIFNNEDLRYTYPFCAVFAALIVGIIGKDLGTDINYTNFLYIITPQKVQSSFGRIFDMLPVLYIFVPLMVFFIVVPIIYPSKKIIIKSSISVFIVLSVLFAGYLNFYWVPRIVEVFSSRQIVQKYFELKKEGDIVVDYNNWKSKSMLFYLGTDEKLHSVKDLDQIVKLVKGNPGNSVFIAVKENDVPKLRAKLFSELGVNISKIMDDQVDTYKDIEFYRVSKKDKVSEDQQEWRKNIIDESEIPRNLIKSGGTFGGGSIEIIGHTINKNRFDAGEDLDITVYYRVNKEIEKNWQIFFHFDVYSGALPRSFRHDAFPLNGFYPTNHWQKGDIIRQETNITVPGDHPGGGIRIYTGFYIGRDRLPVDRDKDNDGQDRFILGTFRVNIR